MKNGDGKKLIGMIQELVKFLDISNFNLDNQAYLNKLSIEILLKMYYNNKIREAQD